MSIIFKGVGLGICERVGLGIYEGMGLGEHTGEWSHHSWVHNYEEVGKHGETGPSSVWNHQQS